MHTIPIEIDGDLVDAINVCSDSCHRAWCAANGVEYGGWNGCVEVDYLDYCAQCGVRVSVDYESDCDGRCIPIYANIIGPLGTFCEHGVPDSVPVHES